MTLRIQILKDKFSQSLGLPFKELLSESAINIALSELKIRYKKRLFDPIVTIPELLAAASTKRLQIYWTLLKVIAHKAVSDRPGRSEPRVRKRRPKAYPLMTNPGTNYESNCKLLKPQVFQLFKRAIRIKWFLSDFDTVGEILLNNSFVTNLRYLMSLVRHIQQINRPFLSCFPPPIILTCSIWRRMTCKFRYRDDICTRIQ